MQSLFNPFRVPPPSMQQGAQNTSSSSSNSLSADARDWNRFQYEQMERYYTMEAQEHASQLAAGFMHELKPRPEPMRHEEFMAKLDAMVQLGRTRMDHFAEGEGARAVLNPLELEKEALRQQEVMETLHDIVEALSKPPCRPGMYEISAELARRCRKFPEAQESLNKLGLVQETYWHHHVLQRREAPVSPVSLPSGPVPE